MKKYLIEFTYTNGEIERVELETDRLKWTIDQYCRNRSILNHKVITEGNSNSKQMLFG